MIKLLLIFLGILLIVIGYNHMRLMELKRRPKKKKKVDPLNTMFMNAGIGTSQDILKQRSTWEKQLEQKPGEIFDNIFNGKIVGLLSS